MKPPSPNFMKWFSLLCRVVLAVIFLWSGIEKITHLELFYEAASNYQILPPVLTRFYSAMLPWLEVLCGFYLLIGLFTRQIAVLTSLLILSFIIALSSALMSGESFDCGCFLGGTEPTPVSPAMLVRNVFLLAAAIFLVFQPGNRWRLDTWLDQPEKS